MQGLGLGMTNEEAEKIAQRILLSKSKTVGVALLKSAHAQGVKEGMEKVIKLSELKEYSNGVCCKYTTDNVATAIRSEIEKIGEMKKL